MATFAFLLHFPWEILQSPFYRNMPDLPHWEAVKTCLLAAFGDVVLVLLGFWAAALGHSRRWILRPEAPQFATYVAVPLVLTVLLERLNVHEWGRWSYAPGMPTLPLIGTGLAPLLQWILLPPVVAWFVRRHVT